MSPFLRKVPTKSGAIAGQIVSNARGQRIILEHLGSAHSAQELAALVAAGREKNDAMGAAQLQLDLGLEAPE